MFSDKSLSIAILISTLFHALIFVSSPHFKDSSVIKRAAALKITYLSPKEIPLKKAQVKKEPRTSLRRQAKRKSPAAKPETAVSFRPEDKPVKKVASAAKSASQHVKIQIPPELPKEKEALYLNYYQSIREKIKRYLANNYPRYIGCGEVSLYFVILSSGKLKQINIVQERSIQNRLLKEIAKKSVLEAAPFLPFPEDLNQPHLPFNVVISFELED